MARHTGKPAMPANEAEQHAYGAYPIMTASSGNSGNTGGKTRFDSIIDALLIAGIIALVSATVVSLVTATRLETAFTERNKFYDREINRVDETNARQDRAIGGLDDRLTVVERGQGASQRNPDDRPKR